MAGPIKEDHDDLDEHHEINVTPFIDVILVLLIIFMVAAPLSTVDVPVDLPGSTATAKARPDKPVFLTIRADLRLSLGDHDVDSQNLASALSGVVANKANDRIFLRADRSVTYDNLMKVMNVLRDAGYLKVALVGLEDVTSGLPTPTVTAPR